MIFNSSLLWLTDVKFEPLTTPDVSSAREAMCVAIVLNSLRAMSTSSG